MIHTKIIPNDILVNLSFYVPKDYVGKEVEVIAFQKEEGLTKKESTISMADFWGILSDDTAKSLKEQVAKNKTDFEDRISKQF